MWNPFAKTFTFDVSYQSKKAGKIENLPGTTTVPELKNKIRELLKLAKDINVKIKLAGGKQMEDEGKLSELKSIKSGTTKILVIASKAVRVDLAEPAAPPPKSKPKIEGKQQFEEIEAIMQTATEKMAEYEATSEGWTAEEKKKHLLWFNILLNVLTRIDGLKISSREEYDAENRGRSLIAKCYKMLDQVDAEKAKL